MVILYGYCCALQCSATGIPLGLQLLQHRSSLRSSTDTSQKYPWVLDCYTAGVLLGPLAGTPYGYSLALNYYTIGVVFGREGLYCKCTLGPERVILYGYWWALKCCATRLPLGPQLLHHWGSLGDVNGYTTVLLCDRQLVSHRNSLGSRTAIL